MEERVARVAANEAVFRELNEQLDDLRPTDDTFSIVCECGDLRCAAPITISHDAYARLREDATTFAIKPGHAKPDVEDVIASYDVFEVVRKKPGLPAKLARETA